MLMAVSWIGKDKYSYIFESLIITILLVTHFLMFIIFLVLMIASKITEAKSANKI
jgi:hypothetical protein